MWAPDDDLLAAWRRLLDRPDTAAEFLAAVLPPLLDALAAFRPGDDPHTHLSAATDAAIEFLKQPERYDPARAPLRAYLTMTARGRLLNLLAAERRHQRRRNPLDPVELGVAARNEEVPDDEASFDSPALRPVVDALSGQERQVLDLMRGGERLTAAFAAVLGVADRPAAEQRAEVKRAKDRIIARLRRAAGGSHA